ncbi:MAG: DUF4920 domain-containing protein [Flavobacteriales bacterium]|nr:DUF4920 domain-containing protein [Flavobacteriales bacterium]
MKKLLFIALAAGLYACGGSHDHDGHDHGDHADHNHEQETMEETPAMAVAMYGADFDTTGAAGVAMMASNVEAGNTNGVYKAKIVESCQKMGCWMSVEDAEGQPMMVYMGDHEFFVPKTGVDGLDCYIAGNAYYDTLSVDFQKHLLEDANAPQEEIDAITEEKYEMAFTATGVMIEGYEAPAEMEGDHDHEHDHDGESHEHDHDHEGDHDHEHEGEAASH